MKQQLPFRNTVGLFTRYVNSRFVLLSLFMFILIHGLNAQFVSTGTVSVTPVCAGAQVTVDFSVTNGTGSSAYYTNSTLYTVYLSNSSGSSFTSIGSFSTTGVTYDATDAGSTTGLNYSATIPAGTISGAGYKISIGSSSPNFDGSTGTNASAAFTINAQVIPSVSVAVNPGQSVCQGTNVTFTSTPANGGSTPAYQWTINGINVGGANAAVFSTNTLLQGDQVAVIMTSSDPCANPLTASSTAITMTVNDLVIPSVGITSTATTVCTGTTITFTAGFPINGGSTPVYQWQVNGIDIAGQTGTTFSTSTLNNNDVVTLQLTSNATCASPNPVISNGIMVTINPDAAIVLSAGNDNQQLCINTALTDITYSITGGGTGGTVTGLPPGVAGIYNAGNFVISGTPTGAGTYNYTISTTGTCTQTSIGGTITVNGNATLSHSSGSVNQSVCINTAIVDIVYNIGGTGNNATAAGLPAGVNAVYNAGSLTISGSPSVSGVFNYSVTATGTCANAPVLSGTITANDYVTPSVSITASASTICTGNPITFTATAVNGGTVPAYQWQVDGSNAGTNSNSFTTSTLTNGQVVTVILTSNESCVTSATATSNSITVTVEDNAVLTQTSGPASQTVCINNAITAIVYTIGGTGNNASATGLPAGVTGTYNAGIFTLSGSPSVAGVYNFSVTASGTCANAPAIAGTITVDDNATINLSSAINTNNQTVCINTAIVNITYNLGGGATGAVVSGLAGTGLNSNVSGNLVTISGIPNAAAVINYTVQTTGPCLTPSATGSVTVNGDATASLASGSVNQSICINTSIGDIVYTIGGTGNNASVTGLPPGINAIYNSGTLTISGTATASGTFNYTVTGTGICANSASLGGTITVNPLAALTLSSAPATASQVKCLTPSSAITTITYSVGGSATGASVTGLPAGVTGNYSTGVFTISGTPTASGVFNYTVTTSGGCGTASLSGTIIIVAAVPAQPSVISGSTAICPVANGLVYSVTNDVNANSYTWTIPAGFTIVSGAGTNAVTVNVGVAAVSGNISVRAVNVCGQSTVRTLAVNVNNFAYANAGPDQTICAGSNVTLAGVIDGVINSPSEWDWITSGTGTINSPNNLGSTYTPSAADIAAGSVTITIQTVNPSGPCNAVSDQMIITIRPLPTVAISGSTTICSGSSASISFTGTPNTTVTYNTSQTINIGPSGTAILNTGALNANTTYTLNSIVYQTVPVCSRSVTGSATITVNQAAVVNAGNGLTACQSAAPAALTLAGASVTGGTTSGQWSIVSGGGTLSNTAFTTTPATVTYTAAANFSGVVTLRLTSADPDGAGPCTAIFADRIITVNPEATANAGVPQNVCAGGSVNLSGSVGGAAASGTWSAASGSFSDVNNLNAIYTPSIASGNVTLTLTTNDPDGAGPCTAAISTVEITVNAAATANAGAAQTVCAGSSVNLNGTVSGSASAGTWSAASGSFSDVNNLNAIYTPSIASGNVTLTLTTNDPDGAGPCTPATSTVVIAVNAIATANAGLPQTVCANGSVVLNGSVGGTAVSGTWSAASGSFSNINDLNAIYTPSITSGNVTLTLTSNDPDGAGPCTAAISTVEITVNAAATANAGPAQTVCAGGSVILNGSVGGSATSGTWSAASGSFSNMNDLNATYTPTITSGSILLTLITDDPDAAGPCLPVSATVVITVDQLPTVNAGANQTICSNQTAGMNATIGGAASSGTWSTAGDGSFSSNATNAVYTPGAADLAAGTVLLTYTTNDPAGPCTSASSSITLTINPAVTISAGADLTICSNQQANLNGSFGGSATSASWATSGTGSFNNNTLPNALYSPSASDIAAGTVTLTYTSDDPAGPCGTASSTIVLTIHKAVVIGTQPSNLSACATSAADFYVVAAGDGLTYQWYKVPATAVINTANISGANSANLHFNMVTLADAGQYYVVVSGVSPCAPVTSATRTLQVDQAIAITVQPQPQTVCAGNNVTFSVTANAAPGDLLTYQWRKNAINIPGAVLSTYTISNVNAADAGNYDVIVQGPSGYTCSSATSAGAALTVTVAPTASISYTSPFCTNNATLQNVSLSGTGSYTGGVFSALPAGLSLNTATGAINPTLSTAGTYTVTYLIAAAGGCNAVSVSTGVNITEAPTASISYAGPYCNNDATVHTVTLSGTAAYSGGSFTAPAGLSINNATGSIDPSLSTAGSYTVTYTIPASAGCASSTVTTTVTITAVPSALISYAGPFCSNDASLKNPTLTGTGAYTGGTYTSTAGLNINAVTGSIDPSLSTAGTYTVTYSFAGAGGCAAGSTTASVTITQLPVASFSYTGTPYCKNGPNPVVSLGGGAVAGTFSSTAGLVFANTSTGEINIAASTAGTYTITNTVAAANGCGLVSATATITITTLPVATFSYAASPYCNNATNPLPAFSGGAVAGIFSSTAGLVFVNTSTGEVNLAASTAGSYTVTNTIAAANGCAQVTATANIIINTPSAGGTLSPALTTECINANSGTITLTGNTGSVIGWELSVNAGTTWTSIANTTNTLNYTNLAVTTLYRAVIQNGGCAPVFSAISIIGVSPAFTPTISSAPTPAVICLGGSITLTASGYSSLGVLSGGDFSQANPAGWNGMNAGNNNGDPNSGWGGSNGRTYNGVFYDSQTLPTGKFMIVNGTGTPGSSILTSPNFSLVGISSAQLTWYQALNFNPGAAGFVELSTNAGASYTTTLASYGPYGTAQTIGNPNLGFVQQTVNLNAYIGQPNLKIRFRYTGTAGSNWAIDNVEVPSNYLPLDYNWGSTPGITGSGQTVTYTPTTTGLVTISVTTMTNSTCPGAGPGSIVVDVRPYATLGGLSSNIVCTGSNATVTLTGLLPGSTSTVTYNINGGPAQTATVAANASGTGTFAVPVLATNNGMPLNITAVSSSTAGGPSCAASFSSSTILTVNDVPAITAQPNAASICPGNNAVMTAAATGTGATLQWEYSTNGGTSWADVPNAAPYSNVTTPNLGVSNVPALYATYLYRLRVNTPAPCNQLLRSTASTLKLKNVWTGNTSTDWNTAANWSDNTVPDLSCADVIILGSRPFQPTLTTSSTINGLTINNNAYLTVNAGILNVAGTITNNGSFDLRLGTLNLNGTAGTQNIAGSMFVNKTIMHLQNSNNTGIAIDAAAGDTLKITVLLDFGSVTNSTITTGNNLTMVSSAAATASLGKILNGNSVTGTAIVERWMPAGRKWRFLSIPTNTSQTVKAAWQEGAATALDNPAPGYGTQITSFFTSPETLGFDSYSPGGHGMKYWNEATQNYLAQPTTNTDPVNNNKGHMLFIRGDRSSTPASFTNTAAVLRTKGSFKTGINTIGFGALLANQFVSVGNPFASAIDLRAIGKTNVSDIYYVWDPKLGGSYGLGAFQKITVSGSGFTVIPGGGSYTAVTEPRVESGSAFMAQAFANGVGSVIIDEDAKVAGSREVLRGSITGNRNLFKMIMETDEPGMVSRLDGLMLEFGAQYSNDVNGDDGANIANTGENIAIIKPTKLLSVERHAPVVNSDTIYLKMTNPRARSYRFVFEMEEMAQPGLQAWLIDKFTNETIPLDLQNGNSYNFTVSTAAGAAAQDRFKIVFKNSVTVPVTFVGVKATRNADRSILVQWKVENEINITNYEVQRSADGVSFTGIITAGSTGAVNYSRNDLSPLTSDNFYRIKATSANGLIQYSAVVKVADIPATYSFNIYPNPVKDKLLQLHYTNLPAGKLLLEVKNTNGQSVLVKTFQAGPGGMESTGLATLAAGNYTITVSSAGDSKVVYSQKFFLE